MKQESVSRYKLPLPYSYKRSLSMDNVLVLESAVLSNDEVKSVYDFTNTHQVDITSLILSVWSILLANYTNQLSIAVMMHPMMESQQQQPISLEHFQPYVVSMNQEDSFIQLVQRLAAKEEQADHDLQHMESDDYFNIGIVEMGLSPLSECQTMGKLYKPELCLGYRLENNEGQLVIQYDSHLFSNAYIKNLLGHLKVLLQQCLQKPASPVLSHNILTTAEYEQTVIQWNQTTKALPTTKTIYQLLEEQVVRSPHTIALEFREQALTYSQLNSKANQIGSYIRQTYQAKFKSTLPPDTVIAVFMERSAELIPSLFGIMKAGGAFLPIDTAYPDERITFILEDSRANVIVTHTSLRDKLQRLTVDLSDLSIICVDEINGDHANLIANLEPVARSGNLAYVIYTSGSTGKPKGALIEHKGAVNLAYCLIEQFQLAPYVRVLQFASMSFDASVFEWVGTLSVGGTMVVLAQDELPPQADITDVLHDRNIHLTLLPPSVIRSMRKRGLPQLKTLISAGEALTEDIVQYWGKHHQLINVYGPTETTVICTVSYCRPDDLITIGKPIHNTQLFVLSPQLNPLPIGVPGELWIGGVGLARGYLNRDDLTSDRFQVVNIQDVNNLHPTSMRLYKTGDIVRWTPSGELEYIGRNDHQVKIRGFRIELGEVEYRIGQFPGITQCVVEVVEYDSNKRLAAYFSAEQYVQESELRTFLGTLIPSYMIPSFFIYVDHIRLNTNGKVDRAALPKPEATSKNVDSNTRLIVEPRNETEACLLSIWGHLLKRTDIGIHDHFFAIGGDSILAIQMVSKAREQGLILTPKLVAENPTVAAIAALACHHVNDSEFRSLSIEGEFGLSPIQQWFVQQQFEDPHCFNQSQILLVKHCDPQRLVSAVQKLVQHHPELTLRFSLRDDNTSEHGYQQYRAEKEGYQDVRIQYHPLQQTEDPDQEVVSISKQWHHHLNFEAGQLLHVGVITGHPDGKDRLVITIHHLVIDGVSWRIVLEDLQRLYQGQEAHPVASRFKDWHAALLAYAQQECTLEQLSYWKKVQEQLSALVLPVDFHDVDTMSTDYSELLVTLPEIDTTRLLKRSAHAYRTQINDLFIAAWALAMSEWTNKSSVAFKLEGHGREHCVADLDTTRTVGWFTTLFPICIHIPASRNIDDTIKSVKEQLRQLPDNGVSYGVLKYCHPNERVRDELNASLPQATFNYLGQFTHGEPEEGWTSFSRETAQDYSSPRNHGTNLLELNCSVVYDQLHLFFKYSRLHFKDSTIEKFADLLVAHLHRIIDHCSQQQAEMFTPSDFPLIEVEQEQLEPIVTNYHPRYHLDNIYPLSPVQLGLLYHYLEHKDSDQYFVQVTWKYEGQIHAERYKQAWDAMISENDCLRTFYVWEKLDAPYQCVIKQFELDWTVIDLSALSAEQQEERRVQLLDQDRMRRFDLSQPCPYRITLLKHRHDEWTMIWSYHHILLDGWSMPLLLNQVHERYDSAYHTTSSLLSYEKYIKWLITKDKSEAISFWTMHLKGIGEPTPLPLLHKEIDKAMYQPIVRQGSETLHVNQDLTEKMDQFVKRTHITLNTLVQFAWGKLLQVYADSDVTTLGVVVSGRGSDLPYANQIGGLLINTLPLVMRWDHQMSITEQLQQLHRDMQELNDYCYLSLIELKQLCEVQQHTLFHSIVAFENYLSDYQHIWDSFQVKDMEEIEKTNYPITITIVHLHDTIHIKFMYDRDYYEDTAILRLQSQLKNIIQFVVEQPDSLVGDIKLLSDEEYNKVIYEWNDTSTDYPRESTIPQLFAEQLQLHAEQPALVHYERVLTYQDVYDQSQYVACCLQQLQMRRETCIGVFLPRAPEFIIAILGILQAGGAYVPIDPDYPVSRVQEIVSAASIETIITCSVWAEKVAEAASGARFVFIDQLEFERESEMVVEHAHQGCDDKAKSNADSTQLAYVMFTSGSTGQPKGVMIEQRSIVRLVKNSNTFPFHSTTRMLLIASPVFDASTFDIWGTLLNGQTLYMVDKEDVLTSVEKWIEKWDITMISISPSFFNVLVQYHDSVFAKLKAVLLGGEVLSIKQINEIKQKYPELMLINGYGPTENTTYSTTYPIERTFKTRVPIGKPISNSTCYILDRYGYVQPIGAIGELYVGGDGVARGYFGQEQLTKEKFIPNPFASVDDKNRGRNAVLYRTGDRARWLEDGHIDFVGRADFQVKIRGFRVECGEIEQHLADHPDVRECIVVVQENELNKQLVAYYTSDKWVSGHEHNVRDFLKERLPSYMLPSAIVRLEQFALNINGKIDRTRLPQPKPEHSSLDIQLAPRNEDEQTISQIWCKVLKLSRISVTDPFLEVGGHSLHALQIVSLMQREGYEVTVRQILLEQTVAKLAQVISRRTGNVQVEKEAVEQEQARYTALPNNGFPLSAVQRRFLKRKLVNHHQFNIPYIALLKKRVSLGSMQQALSEVIQKHDTLRLTFKQLDDGTWYQLEQELNSDTLCTLVCLEDESMSHDSYITQYCTQLQDQFDIKSGLLFKAVLFDRYQHQDQQVLLLLFHHIIFDGISLQIFLEDLKHALGDHMLPSNGSDAIEQSASSYREWCENLLHYAQTANFEQPTAYWKAVLEAGRSLQVDMENQAIPTHRTMNTLSQAVLTNADDIRLLKQYTLQHQTTHLGVLLTALMCACYDLKKQTDILLHLMSYQRESFVPSTEIFRTIGFFAGAYPIRIQANEKHIQLREDTELVGAMKQTLEHVPAEGLDYFVLKHVLPDIQTDALQLPDSTHMLFHYMSQETDAPSNDFYEQLSIPFGHTNSPDNPSAYLLNMTVTQHHNRLHITCYYSTLHFEQQTIQTLLHLFTEHLNRMIMTTVHSELTAIGEGRQ
ncbi:non-ribosomal peptide synthetase [Paenibacillus sp. 481]|uniref:non-ribosomal peptide synthetase n=1 Tax=Paenibacillus sp. 481 TaxID=2835869 RepID=UPI001E35E35E|nr:non-ribosomal peptide synthetase [Paenibacillus sp. 481]UHA72258.1 amino acid adenylation domain-containing protein [Paenibacillus sp. 481]